MTDTQEKPTALDIVLTRPWRRSQSELLLTYLHASSYRHSLFSTLAMTFLNQSLDDSSRHEVAEQLLLSQRDDIPVGSFIRQFEVTINHGVLVVTATAVDVTNSALKRSAVDYHANQQELVRLNVSKDTPGQYVVDETLLESVLLEAVQVIDTKINRTVDLNKVRWLCHINRRDVRGKKNQQGRAHAVESKDIVRYIKDRMALGRLKFHITKHALVIYMEDGVYNISRPHLFT